MSKIQSICVYCGSQPGNLSEFSLSAQNLGKVIASNGIELVYGGGARGIMGSVSQAVRDEGGKVTGVIPEFLLQHEGEGEISASNPETIVTRNMHERKQKMFELSDGFIALPGGIGTLEELIEILTWAQLRRHSKTIGLLNTNGFWNPLLELIDHMKASGFLHTSNRINPVISDDPEQLVHEMITSD